MSIVNRNLRRLERIELDNGQFRKGGRITRMHDETTDKVYIHVYSFELNETFWMDESSSPEFRQIFDVYRMFCQRYGEKIYYKLGSLVCKINQWEANMQHFTYSNFTTINVNEYVYIDQLHENQTAIDLLGYSLLEMDRPSMLALKFIRRWKAKCERTRYISRSVVNIWMHYAMRPIDGTLYKLYKRKFEEHSCQNDFSNKRLKIK